jgi:hypothetical protein
LDLKGFWNGTHNAINQAYSRCGRQQKEEALAMANRYPIQRSSPRAFILCPISVSFQSCEAHGIVRDISDGGIFLYLNSKPPLSSEITFSLRLKGEDISGTGEVVRIEEPAPGAAIGVAIKISSYNNQPHTPIATQPPA